MLIVMVGYEIEPALMVDGIRANVKMLVNTEKKKEIRGTKGKKKGRKKKNPNKVLIDLTRKKQSKKL